MTLTPLTCLRHLTFHVPPFVSRSSVYPVDYKVRTIQRTLPILPNHPLYDEKYKKLVPTKGVKDLNYL